MLYVLDDVCKILDTGNSSQKIKSLQKLSSVDDPCIITKIIECLDDDDLQVRGEAFSLLILDENSTVSKCLIDSLTLTSKNIRAFASLVLANRGDSNAIPNLVKLACDESSMVRSCAVGALGYLGANDSSATDVMKSLLFDDSVDVKKSAAHSLITVGCRLSSDVLFRLSEEWNHAMQSDDTDLKILFKRLKKSVQ